MKKILNLIGLQFETVFSLKKMIAIIFVIASFYAFIDPSLITITGLLFLMATCYTTAFYEEKSKSNYLIRSLPIRAKDYILSRYIYVAINTLISILLTTVLYKVFIYFGLINKNESLSLWLLGIIVGVIGIFMMSIVTPLELLLGFEKGRIVIIFLTLSPMVFANFLLNYIPLINLNSLMVKILILLCLITLILTSYFITSNLYAKKDF